MAEGSPTLVAPKWPEPGYAGRWLYRCHPGTRNSLPEHGECRGSDEHAGARWLCACGGGSAGSGGPGGRASALQLAGIFGDRCFRPRQQRTGRRQLDGQPLISKESITMKLKKVSAAMVLITG